MAYEPLNLQNGQTLTAEDLQHMEQGIVNTGGVLCVCIRTDGEMDYPYQPAACSATYQQVTNAFVSGLIGAVGFSRYMDWVHVYATSLVSDQPKHDGSVMKAVRFQASGCDIYLFEDDTCEIAWFD